MRTKSLGTYVLQPVEPRTRTTEICFAKRIAEVDPNRPFIVMGANIKNLPVLVRGHKKHAEVRERPISMVNVAEDVSTKAANSAKEKDSDNAVSVYKGKVDNDERIRLHQQDKTDDRAEAGRDRGDRLMFNHAKYEEYRPMFQK